MNRKPRTARTAAVFLLAAGFLALPASAQEPKSVPLDKPIIIRQAKGKDARAKFQGTVIHANGAQITVRGIQNELAIRTFPLSRAAADKMQKIIDRGGYQYGDKVTVIFDPVTQQALDFKGKPSRPR